MNKQNIKNSPCQSLATEQGELVINKGVNKLTSCLNSLTNIPQKAIVKYRRQGNDKVFEVSGRYGQTLYWLIKHKDRGITAKSVCNTAYRLASYIHNLRHKRFMEIETQSEPHDGGQHARYWLKSDIEITNIIINGIPDFVDRKFMFFATKMHSAAYTPQKTRQENYQQIDEIGLFHISSVNFFVLGW